jgi:hypothetical protein
VLFRRHPRSRWLVCVGPAERPPLVTTVAAGCKLAADPDTVALVFGLERSLTSCSRERAGRTSASHVEPSWASSSPTSMPAQLQRTCLGYSAGRPHPSPVGDATLPNTTRRREVEQPAVPASVDRSSVPPANVGRVGSGEMLAAGRVKDGVLCQRRRQRLDLLWTISA